MVGPVHSIWVRCGLWRIHYVLYGVQCVLWGVQCIHGGSSALYMGSSASYMGSSAVYGGSITFSMGSSVFYGGFSASMGDPVYCIWGPVRPIGSCFHGVFVGLSWSPQGRSPRMTEWSGCVSLEWSC